MKFLFSISGLLILSITIYLFTLAYTSKSKSTPGLISDQLSKCPATPNCVCSEFKTDETHFINPIHYSQNQRSTLLQAIKNTLQTMDGKTVFQSNTYIAATFTSRIFKFIDDFEIRIDDTQQIIHVRSASRVGRGDMGANLKRANEFKKLLENHLK